MLHKARVDEGEHSKVSTAVCLQKMVEELRCMCPELEHGIIYSDGAASQFKSHYMMELLRRWQVQLGIKFEWLFFATSHGKGVVDGIGAVLKHTAHNINKSEVGNPCGTRVDSVASFLEVVGPRTKVQLAMYDSVELETMRREFSALGSVAPVVGIHGLHAFSFETGVMSSAMVATDVGLCRPTPREATSATTTMAVPSLPRSTGTLVVVAYEDGWYLGEVAETGSNGHLHVLFMKKGAKFFSWTIIAGVTSSMRTSYWE